MIGIAKEPVLPEPVCARPIRSRPWIPHGMASAWILVGSFHPNLRQVSASSVDTPRISQLIGAPALSISAMKMDQWKIRVRQEARATSRTKRGMREPSRKRRQRHFIHTTSCASLSCWRARRIWVDNSFCLSPSADSLLCISSKLALQYATAVGSWEDCRAANMA